MRNSGNKQSSSKTLSSSRLSAKKTCLNEPANVVTSLLDRLESLRDIGVRVPSVGTREATDGFRAVFVVLYDAMDPFRCAELEDTPE